jgi:hypothetical protein
VRSESRLLVQLLGDTAYRQLLLLVRRHRGKPRPRGVTRRLNGRQGPRRS